jgi:hypothetical protein
MFYTALPLQWLERTGAVFVGFDGREMHKSLVLLVLLFLVACQSAYYGAAEKVGYPKRDILVDRVEQSRDAQQVAEVQFQSALDQLTALAAYDGGDLEDMYDAMDSENDRCIEAAVAVRDRIAKVEHVADALFTEWEDEIEAYTNARLKADSTAKLRDTRTRYNDMITVLRRSESKMGPVLAALNDNTLYLKHNLNAKAVTSLKVELGSIEDEITVLISDMRSAIASSDAFIQSMQ